MKYASSELTSKYLRSRKIPSTACSGCGLGMNHKIVVQAIQEQGLRVEDIVWGTSIGCAGRQTFGTWKGDGFAGTHGRVYAIARGLRIALPPEKRLILTVGDGDAFGIGLNHLIHAARSNADMTVIVNDNLGYQSTGGQYGWTTPQGSKTDSSPYGMFEPNLMSQGMDVLADPERGGRNFPGASRVHGRPAGRGKREEGHSEQRLFLDPHALPLSDQLCFPRTGIQEPGEHLPVDQIPCRASGQGKSGHHLGHRRVA